MHFYKDELLAHRNDGILSHGLGMFLRTILFCTSDFPGN